MTDGPMALLTEIPADDPVENGSGPGWTLHDELCDEWDLNACPWLYDRDSELWAAVPWTWRGEAILWPFAGDMRPATRASVEAAFGPLVDEPHCRVCGSTMLREDGTCSRRLDTIAHPKR
ncbi:hypothetical protein [Kitasatospora sp. NBC_01302]|uniref:hypothetical protein n=1 Tax=Kitasatospora sp. NBC_01302 TaxID=2903575 RepID=UPI002E0DE783|nr:hypothetical protein OG294_14030 [Kitasatospora sp. NBC_01302]